MIKSKIFQITLIILLALICVLFPTLKLVGDVYYSFAVYGVLIFVIILILLLRINIKYKVIIIAVLFYIYRNNFFLTTKAFYNIIKQGYIHKVANRKDDTILRKVVYNIYSNLNLKLNFNKLPNYPSIFVCNYCSDRLENFACILIPKDIAILMRDTLIKISKLHLLIKWPIYVKAKDSYEETKIQVMEHINAGRSVFSYVSKTPRLGPTHIQNMRSGMFKIAKELNLPVTPIVIDSIDMKFGAIPYQNFNLEIGDSFYVDDINQAVINTKKFYTERMKFFQETKYTT